MQFSTGQTVVHPHHGPATVTEVTSRVIGGRTVEYLQLEVHRTNIVVGVPLDSAEDLGVRTVFGSEELQRLLEVLRAPTEHEEQSWSRRFKANQEKLRVGDLLVTAGLVRDLIRRADARGLSAGEKEMLRYAQRPVLAELALSLTLTDEGADDLLARSVLGTDDARLPVAV